MTNPSTQSEKRIKFWLYWELTMLRDKDLPDILVRFIDWIRDLLWEEDYV